jgi:hypothetical protein
LELIAENMAIWKKIPSKSSEFGPFFFHAKAFVKVEIIFFRLKFGEISLQKNCDNQFGYKQKSLKITGMQAPFVTNPWQVVREVRCAQSDMGGFMPDKAPQ